jgi:Tol biopolymer transport system component
MDSRRVRRGLSALGFAGAAGAIFVACSAGAPGEPSAGQLAQPLGSFPKASVDQDFAQGRWSDALATCETFGLTAPLDCTANYCQLIANTMLVVDSLNTFVLPAARSGLPSAPVELEQSLLLSTRLEQAIGAAGVATAQSCEYDLASAPLLVGDASDPILSGEIRGTWTTRTAAWLGAMHSAFLYDLQNVTAPPPLVSLSVPLQSNPPLPPLLSTMKAFLSQSQKLLFARPTTPSELRGGWFDRNGDLVPESPDELLIDIFVPGTNQRVFDFSSAEFVPGEMLPQRPLTPTAALPASTCGYEKFHIDTLASGASVGSADGVTLSPDGSKAAIPLTVNGQSQIYTLAPDGTDATCLTCTQPGNNDGARWQPGGDVILFVSTRDHADAIGGDGAGFGQELYAMHSDGTSPTRLTFSDVWATNYHANFSPDGQHVVWGRTEDRAWDVMVADFVSGDGGMRLTSPRRVVHDTTWWEPHGFTSDGSSILATNTRAGLLSTDIYAVDLSTGARTRLTSNLTWDEHAHLSPDGSKVAWISGRWHPAAVAALNDGSLSPIEDFFWIVPGIFAEFAAPPAGYTTELSLMSADGTQVRELTTDNQVVADNQWSADGRRVIFRQTDPVSMSSRIRLLTFDDCP